jgi:hypothetical protein
MLRRLKGTVKEEIWNSMPSKLPPLIISGGANNFAATSFKIKREDACNQVIKHILLLLPAAARITALHHAIYIYYCTSYSICACTPITTSCCKDHSTPHIYKGLIIRAYIYTS